MPCVRGMATVTAALQLLPPSRDPHAISELRKASLLGTITMPLGRICGFQPRPKAEPDGCFGAPQVAPPSVEVLIHTRSPSPLSSHSAYQCPKNRLPVLSSQAT